MIIESNRSLRADKYSAVSSSHFSAIAKTVAWAGLSIALASCSGEDPSQAEPQTAGGLKPKVAVAGQSLVGLGPLSSANLAAFDADRNGAVVPDSTAVATSQTEISGVFELLVPAEHSGLVVTSFGGSYIDQTDQDQDGDARREFTLGSADTAVQTWLPAGEDVVVLNLLTEALYIKSLGEASGGNFDEIFQTNRDKAAESIGFDVVSTVPSNPIDPASTDLDSSKQYGMFLGGLANAVNAVAAKLGLAAPDADLLRAIALDLVDGDLDGTIRGVEISVEAGFLPNDVDLKAEITRFRNNNFQPYQDVALVEFESSTFGEPTVVPNRAPIAIDDSEYTTLRGETLVVSDELGVLSNDSDPDGDSLTAVLDVTAPSATLVLDSDGGFSFAPSTDAIGSQTFSYIATDSELNSEPATVTVTVLNVGPTAVDDSVTLAQGGGASIDVLNNDSDDTVGLTINQVDTPNHGSASILNNRIVYQHDGDSTETDVFSYQIIDADGATATATLSIAIIPGNKAPTVANPIQTQAATEEQLFDFVFADNVFVDEDGDVLSYAARKVGDLPLPSWLSFVPAQRRFIGTPDEPDLQSFDIELEAADGNGGIASLTFSLIINTVNDAPTIAPLADVTADEDAVISSIPVTVSDVETPSSLVVTATSSNQLLLPDASVSVSGSGSSHLLAITPAANKNGVAVITVTVDDGTDSASETFTLTVNAVNDQPTITAIADVTIDEDQAAGPLAFSIGDLETAANDLLVTAVSDNQALVANTDIQIQGAGENRTIAFQPLADEFGSAEITVTVDDGDLSQQVSFAVTVTPVNDAPSFALDGNNEVVSEDSGPQTVLAKAASISAGPNEAGQSVSFIVINDNNSLFSDQPAITADGDLSFTPAADANGVASVSVVAVDDGTPSASSTSQNFTITVEAVNDAPSFALDGNDEQTDEDAPPVTVSAKAQDISAGSSDELDQTVSFTVTNDNNTLFSAQPAINNAGELTYTLAPDAFGVAVVSVTAIDDGSPSASSLPQAFNITANPVNDAATVSTVNDLNVNEDDPISPIPVTVDDVESGAAAVVLSAVSSNQFVVADADISVAGSGANRSVQLNLVPEGNGVTTITLTADDGDGGTSSTSFTVNVAAVNDAPFFITTIGDQISAEDATVGPLSFSFDDVETPAGSLIRNVFSSDQSVIPNGSIAVGGTGGNRTLSYTPVADASGSAVITVEISDGVNTTPFSFTATINAVNDAPDFVLDGNNETVNEDAGAQTVAGKVANATPGPADEFGQTISYTVSNDNNALFSAQPAIDASGTLSYTPAVDAFGSATVTVTAVDDGSPAASSASQTFTITVNAVNDAPSFTLGGNETVNEDAGAQSVAGKASAISAGPANESTQSVSFTVTNSNNVLFSAQPAIDTSGQLTYTPAADANGSATVTVTAVDDGSPAASSASQTFIITVNAVNDAPDFVLDGNNETINEDAGAQTVSGKVANATPGPVDEFGQTISYTVSNDNNALFSAQPAIDASGTLTYTPAVDAFGSAMVTVTAVDDGSPTASSASQTFTITVAEVNDAPSFALDGNNAIVNEDGGAQSIAGKALSISSGPASEVGQTVNFNVTNDNTILFSQQPTIDASGTLRYTPAPQRSGSAVVSVFVQDDGGTANGGVDSSAVQTFTISVTEVNDPPSFSLTVNPSTNEDSGPQSVSGLAVSISPGPTSESDQTVSFILTTSDDSLFAVLPAVDSSGRLTYTPAVDANTAGVTISITAQDDGGVANGGNDTSTTNFFSITINPINDAPSFVLDGNNEAVNEDLGPQVVAAKAGSISPGPADESGQTVSFNVSNDNNSLFSVQPAIDTSGQLTYTPAADANGSATVTVTAVDDGTPALTSAASQVFTIAVNAVNDAPSFVLDGNNETVAEDAGAQTVGGKAASISAGPSDEATQNLTFVVINDNNALFSVQPTLNAAGQLSYTTAPDAVGTALVDVTLSDSGGTANGGADTSAVQSFAISVTQVNDIPSFALDGNNESVNEDAGAQIVAGKATGISAGPANESTQSVSFNVSNDNNALFSVQPAIDAAGQLTYTPAANANGVATITVTAQDDGSPVQTTANQQFTITVSAVNDAPGFVLDGNNETVAEDAGAQTVAAKAGTITAGPTDEATQIVSFTVTNDNNTLFSVQPALDNAGQLSYTPAADAVGVATVTVIAVDNGGVANGGVDSSASQSFDITITEVNDAPSFALDGNNEAVNEDAGAQSVAGKALSISPGPASEAGQTVSFNVSNDNNALFSVQPAIDNSGQLTYTPAPDANGVAAVFVIAVDDGSPAGSTLSSTFSITVNAVNDAPSFTLSGNESILEDAGAQVVANKAGSISAGPADESTQTVSFAVTNDNNALFSVQPAIDAAGELSYTPAADANGVATVTVTAVDNGSPAESSADQTFTISVTAVNDAPSFVLDGNNEFVSKDTGTHTVAGKALSISAGPADESAQAVSFNLTNGNNALFSVQPAIDAVGQLTYTLAAGATGTATVTVIAVDDGTPTANSVGQLFNITVASVEPVTFSPTLNSVTAGPNDIVITNFVDEGGNPADLAAGSGATGTLVDRQYTADPAVINDGTTGELVISQNTILFPNETVRITYSDQIQDVRGISNSRFVQEFRAASGGPGDGNLVHRPTLEFAMGDAAKPVALDADNDGDLDVVFGDLADGVWLNDGFGNFSAHPSPTAFGTSTFVMDSADMNGDGAIDIIRSTFSNVEVWLNDGTGVFSLSNSQSIGAPIDSISGDIDGDGDIDVIVSPSGFVTEDGYVFVNDGTGTLAPHATATFGSNRNISDLQFADFDNDGDLDIYTASSDTHNIWSNDGSGVFARTQFITSQNSAQVNVADLDGDGYQDVILVVRQGGSNAVGDIRVLINDGAGQLVLGPEQDIGDFTSAKIGDMDADGDFDVVVLRNLDLHVALNDGSNNFTLQPSVNATGQSYEDFVLFDLDSDRDLDVVQITPFAARSQNIWMNNAAPVASLDNNTIDENQANAIVGVLTATEDPGETASFALVAGAGDTDNALFTVTMTPGGIYHLNVGVTPLNFENQQNYSTRIQTNDGAGGISEQVFAVTALDVNEAPVIAALAGLTVNEGAVALIQTAELNVVDVDAAHGPAEVEYTLTTAPTNGALRLSGIGLALNDTFTQQDIDNDLLDYDHVGNETTTDVFSFSALDPEGLGVTGINFNITVTPVNDAPVLVTNSGLTLAEGANDPIDNTLLVASDVDDALTNVTFTVTTLPLNGEVQRSGVALGLNGTFTMDDVDNSLVSYNHFGGENLSDSFGFSLTDAAGDGPTGQAFNITVTPVNDAPVLVTNNGLTLDEGATAAIDNTLLVASDDDNALADVVFTITAAPLNGELQRSGVALEASSTFSMQDVDNGLIGYIHAGGEGTADSFSFDLTDPAGDGPIGQTFAITVTPVNDGPAVTLPISQASASLGAIDISALLGGTPPFSDADAAGNDVQVTISADAIADVTIDDTGVLAGKAAGNNSPSVVVTASIADINSVINSAAGLAATPSALGSFNLTFAIDDLGNVGSGGALQASDFIQIAVNEFELASLDGANGIVLQNSGSATELGADLTNIGDINADGLADFAVAAVNVNRNPLNQADTNFDTIEDGSENGVVYVIYGNSSALVNGFDLDSLDGSNGFVVLGADGTGSSGYVDTQLGTAVSSAGDFNGDGIVDLLIGSPESDSLSGRAYVIFGEAGRAVASIDLSNNNDAEWLALETATGPNDGQLGFSLASTDFDADGFSDVVIGAPRLNNNVGAVFVIYGDALYGPGSGITSIDVNAAINDIATGARFDGPGPNERTGQSVATGNLYGGPTDAIVIGSRMSGDGDVGGAFVVRNGPASPFPVFLPVAAADGTQILGDVANINLGISVDVVPDMNGDNYPELVLGAKDNVADGTENAGWIIPGFATPPAANVIVTDAGLNAIRLTGTEGDFTGHNIASAGDFNGDGLGDLIVAAGGRNGDTGAAYLVFGDSSLAGPTIDLNQADGSSGIRFLGVDAADQETFALVGMAASSAGDINGDGYDDLLLGARNAAHLGGPITGNAYLVFGGPIGNSLPIVDVLVDTATAAGELVIGSVGDDVLDGLVGNDVLLAGAGDDVLVFDPADVRRVAGGLGDDTLQAPDTGSIHTTSFSTLMAAANYALYESIEIVELPDAGRTDTYEFDMHSIRHMTDERNTLRVTGNITGTAPRVQASDAWLPGGQVVEGPVTYNVFFSAVAEVYLYVDDRIDSTNVVIVSLAKRVSESTAGVEANQGSNFAKVSGNGRYVVYQSTASNLDQSVTTTGGRQHIYRTDLLTNETIMISQSGESEADAPSFDPCISYDGSRISYATSAQNIVGTLIEEQILVDVADSAVGTAISLSVGSSVTNECDFSTDGNFVAFYSDDEIYRYGIVSGQTDLISTDMFSFDICTGIEQCGGIALNGDGSLAVFSTPVALSPAGDFNSGHDIVLANVDTGERTLITAGKDDQSARPDISADGNRIVFESAATNVTGFDSNGHPDIFIYDVATDTFGRASTNDTGGATSVPTGITVSGDRDGAGDPAISGDGEFFTWLGNQVGFSLSDNKVTAYLKHVSGAINNSVLVGEAYRYHLDRFGNVFANVSDGVSIDFVGQHLVFHTASNNVEHGTANQIVDGNAADDVFVAENPIYVENLVANSDGDALTNATEIALGTNPGSSDTDGDGLSDFDEVNRDGDPTTLTVGPGGDSDPFNQDSDADGINDGLEVAYNADPTLFNTVLYASQGGGNDANDGLSWVTALRTNSLGVGQSVVYTNGGDPGDPVYVLYEPGVYDNLGAGGSDVILIGGMGPTRNAPISSTASVFEGSAVAAPSLTVSGQTGVIVESLSFRHAAIASGRLIDVANADITIRNAVVAEQFANTGGGLKATGSLVDIVDSIFANNTAEANQNGDEIGGAINAETSTVTVAGSLFEANVAISDGNGPLVGGVGGAISVSNGGSLTVTDSVFIANETLGNADQGFEGGGAISADIASNLFATNNQFIANISDGYGGAIRVRNTDNGAQFVAKNNLFFANTSSATSLTADGGAIAVADTIAADITNNTLAYNQSSPNQVGGSGITLTTSGGIDPTSAFFNVVDNIICNNPSPVAGTEEDNIELDSAFPLTALGRQFNNVQANTEANDIDADPIFTNGFYLGSQGGNSSVDGGSNTAANLSLGAPFTTRIDGVADAGQVDIGYHYDKGDEQFASNVTASPGVGACTGNVDQEFSLSDLDGQFIDGIRTVAAEVVSADVGLGTVTLLGVGSIDPTGNGSALLRPLPNGSYLLTVQTDQPTQVGDLTLDIYVDDMVSPITSLVITYSGPC